MEKSALFGLAGLSLILVLSAQVRGQEGETRRIAVSELKERLDRGEKLLLIDVREDEELERDGAIPGALHIPVAELEKRMKDIPKDVRLVFY